MIKEIKRETEREGINQKVIKERKREDLRGTKFEE
jgi:hypothetical protein